MIGPFMGGQFAQWAGDRVAFAVLVVQYLVWGMPEPFRKWLNRNNKTASSAVLDKYMAMSEEELMNMAGK